MHRTANKEVSLMEQKSHICEDNLDSNCKCKLCGKVWHDWEDDDDGSFAASGKIVTPAACAAVQQSVIMPIPEV